MTTRKGDARTRRALREVPTVPETPPSARVAPPEAAAPVPSDTSASSAEPPQRDSRERCVWRVLGVDGAQLAEGSFFELDYETAVTRARSAAAPHAHPGVSLLLEIGKLAVLTLQI